MRLLLSVSQTNCHFDGWTPAWTAVHFHTLCVLILVFRHRDEYRGMALVHRHQECMLLSHHPTCVLRVCDSILRLNVVRADSNISPYICDQRIRHKLTLHRCHLRYYGEMIYLFCISCFCAFMYKPALYSV